MSRKVGTEVYVVRSEKWEVEWSPRADGITEQEHVRCCREGSWRVVRFDGTWLDHIQTDHALAPMRAAAERIWWENKTPGKDEFRTFEGSLYRMKDPGFSNLEIEVLHEGPGCSGNRRIEIKGLLDRYKKTIIAWHRANYVLEDDEYYGAEGPAKMRDDQVRDMDGVACDMSATDNGNVVFSGSWYSVKSWLNNQEAQCNAKHPMHITSQRARIEAFLARNAKAETKLSWSSTNAYEDKANLGFVAARPVLSVGESGIVLAPSDLRKLAETATGIADRIEGKPVGRPVPIE